MLAALAAGAAQAAAPELSVSDRLKDRRYVAAGERTRVIGFEDGRFYANGWHIAGEMGGVWSEPIKLVDGVWFGIDDQWIGPATSFRSGWGYAEMDLPTTAGLQLERTDFAPDQHRAGLFGLKLTNPGAATRTVTVKVDAHSELLAEYPWSFDNTPHARDQLPDTAAFDGDALVFREQGKLPHPNATVHDYAALVAADRDPFAGETGASPNGYRGPQGTNVCSAQELPSLCDDGPFGKGKGGQLRYSVTVPAGGSETLWVAVAGSDKGIAEARAELAGALADPAGQLEAKIADRERGAITRSSRCRATRASSRRSTGASRTSSTSRGSPRTCRSAGSTRAGSTHSRTGTLARARWVGAGFPDYPWMFATDGEYTAFASVAVGQFEQIKDHLRALRRASDILNDGSGVVTHEVISDGSNWFGRDSRRTDPVTVRASTTSTPTRPSSSRARWR